MVAREVMSRAEEDAMAGSDHQVTRRASRAGPLTGSRSARAEPDTPAADYTSVLVPLDGSEAAARALGTAGLLAERFGAGLHVVAAGVSRAERWWYEDYLGRLEAGPTTHLSDRQDVGAAILATARSLDPCLVCLATHGRSRLAGLVGSTFADLTGRARQPVVAVGPHVAPTAATLDRVAVCLDGKEVAERAVPVAASWAVRLGLRVSLLTAADPLQTGSRMQRHHARSSGRYRPDGNPHTYLAVVVARPELDGLMVDREVLWTTASPHLAIGQHLDHHPATLAVATTHGRTGLARAVLGSEVAHIIHRSRVPALIVPPAPPG
jgi:nucleotide-binding universal stress UspA family protein